MKKLRAGQLVSYVLDNGTLHKGRIFTFARKYPYLVTIYDYLTNQYHQVWSNNVKAIYNTASAEPAESIE